MINKKHRFHGRKSIKLALDSGKRRNSRVLSIRIIDNHKSQYSRAAIIISKKVFKLAVKRNRVRRRIYEILRQELPRCRRVVDMVVVVYSSKVWDMTSSELRNEIEPILYKARLIPDANGVYLEKQEFSNVTFKVKDDGEIVPPKPQPIKRKKDRPIREPIVGKDIIAKLEASSRD